MSIKIYSCNDSRGLRPMWTAEEMGVSYESEMMPFPPRFLHKEYMDVTMGQCLECHSENIEGKL